MALCNLLARAPGWELHCANPAERALHLQKSEAASPFICALQADPAVGNTDKGKRAKKAAATAAADADPEAEVCAHLGLLGHTESQLRLMLDAL